MTQAISLTAAISTTQFTSRLGVNTHENYYNTAYSDESAGIADLNYLGINYVRDGLPDPYDSNYWVSYEQAMASGIKFDFSISYNEMDIVADIAVLDALEKMHPGGIVAVEGLNEVDPSQIAMAEAFQSKLYTAVHADPLLQGVSVYSFTVLSTNTADYAAEGSMSGMADDGNIHISSYTVPPIQFDSWFPGVATQDMGSAPFVVTETDYDTMPSAYAGVNDDVQAKYLLNDLFDLATEGASRTYIYELLDELPDPTGADVQQHFGLFNNDGTPKEAAVALHNLTTILNDTGSNAATFTPGSLAYTVTGLDSADHSTEFQQDYYYGILQSIGDSLGVYGNSLLMEKSSGAFDLAVWQEPNLWNPTTMSEVTVAATPVTVTLGSTAEAVKVFDPLLGTSAIATYTNVNSVTLSVTDHPLIVEIDPMTTITAETTSLPSGTNISTGQTVTFALTASEALQVTGAPTLALSNGGAAHYDARLSGGNTLVFDYTAAASQSTSDLLLTSINLNGGSIVDATGNELASSQLSNLPGSNTGIGVNAPTVTVMKLSGASRITGAQIVDTTGGTGSLLMIDTGARVNVAAGSALSVTGALEVGVSGSGSFALAASATKHTVLNTGNTEIGFGAGSAGSMVLNGVTWNVNGFLWAGYQGTAYLNITGGSVVHVSANLAVSYSGTARDQITLSGGSTLDVLGSARFGVSGAPSLATVAVMSISTGSTLNVQSSLRLNSHTTLVMAGGTMSAGTAALGAGSSVTGSGLVQVASGELVNNGAITARGGALEITGSVIGSGSLRIAADSTIKIDGKVLSQPTIAFIGSNATLSLAAGFAGKPEIDGFAIGDQITMAGIDKASWNAATQMLTLSEAGKTVDNLHLVGNYGADIFNLQQVGGAAIITLQHK